MFITHFSTPPNTRNQPNQNFPQRDNHLTQKRRKWERHNYFHSKKEKTYHRTKEKQPLIKKGNSPSKKRVQNSELSDAKGQRTVLRWWRHHGYRVGTDERTTDDSQHAAIAGGFLNTLFFSLFYCIYSFIYLFTFVLP